MAEIFGSVTLPKEPILLNQEMHRGDDKDIEVTVVDENNVAVDLTGAAVSFGVKRSSFSSTTFITKSSAVTSEAEITNPSKGQLIIHIDPVDTANLVDEFVGLYDIQITDSTGKKTTIIRGRFRVLVDFAL